jgi:hypothetical protein
MEAEGTELCRLEITERTTEKKNTNADALARPSCSHALRGIKACSSTYNYNTECPTQHQALIRIILLVHHQED